VDKDRFNTIWSNFFRPMFEYCDGFIEHRPIPGRPSFFGLSEAEDFRTALTRSERANHFFGIATRDGKGGKKENIVNIPCAWADVDFKDTPKTEYAQRIARFAFRPTLGVITGGGVHLYWLFKEPLQQADSGVLEDVNRRIAYFLGGDFNSCDTARILRVPETTNWKYDPPRPVVLRHVADFRYDISDFLELPKPPETRTRRETYFTDSRDTLLDGCAFFRWCKQYPERVSEPLWYALLSNLVAIRPGGISLCHRYSKGHPKYTPAETEKKALHAIESTKPHSCEFIKANGFDQCGRCSEKSPIARFFKAVQKDSAYVDISRFKALS